MALIDFAPVSRPSVAGMAIETWRAVGAPIARWRKARARKLTLCDMLAMEPHRLRDLGISVFDVEQAIRRGPPNRG